MTKFSDTLSFRATHPKWKTLPLTFAGRSTLTLLNLTKKCRCLPFNSDYRRNIYQEERTILIPPFSSQDGGDFVMPSGGGVDHFPFQSVIQECSHSFRKGWAAQKGHLIMKLYKRDTKLRYNVDIYGHMFLYCFYRHI